MKIARDQDDWRAFAKIKDYNLAGISEYLGDTGEAMDASSICDGNSSSAIVATQRLMETGERIACAVPQITEQFMSQVQSEAGDRLAKVSKKQISKNAGRAMHLMQRAKIMTLRNRKNRQRRTHNSVRQFHSFFMKLSTV